MSTFLTVAAIALAGAKSAAAQAECQSILDAAYANGLNRLGDVVYSILEEENAALLKTIVTATRPFPEEEKVTVFAPQDAAWPPAEALPNDHGATLQILLGHVVPTYLPSSTVIEAVSAGPAMLATVAGTDVTASLEGEDVYVAAEGQDLPGAKVVVLDVETCAGVIHVVDKVLLADAPIADPMMVDEMTAPMMADEMMVDDDAMADEVMADDMMAEAPTSGECTSLVDAITANNLTRLGDAVLSLSDNDNATALLSLATATDELPEADKLTLFAPENAAWPAAADLPTGEALLDVLLGHVVPAFLESPAVIEAVSGGEPVALDTLAMTKINATLEGEDIFVAADGMMSGAKVIALDVQTCIGVVHVIDKVLIASEEAAAPAPTTTPRTIPSDGPTIPEDPSTMTEEADDTSADAQTNDNDTQVAPPTNGAASKIALGAVMSVAAAAAMFV